MTIFPRLRTETLNRNDIPSARIRNACSGDHAGKRRSVHATFNAVFSAHGVCRKWTCANQVIENGIRVEWHLLKRVILAKAGGALQQTDVWSSSVSSYSAKLKVTGFLRSQE